MASRWSTSRSRFTRALAALRADPTAPVELPAAAVEPLRQLLDILSRGETPIIVRCPEAMTTQEAADLLGLSRPTVARLCDEGTLPSSRVGAHRRLDLVDVLAYRQGRT